MGGQFDLENPGIFLITTAYALFFSGIFIFTPFPLLALML